MSSNGVFTTIINLIKGKYDEWNFSFSAIDGSFHEVQYIGGNLAYVVVSKIEGEVKRNKILTLKIDYEEKICENCKVEDEMREMEYEKARNASSDIIFLDRKISIDNFEEDNVIAIVKDPSERISINGETPWLLPVYEKGKIRGAYFKLFPFSWIFLVETTLNMDWSKILYILYFLGSEPIPEALGYNYPLFLADKVAKFYRDKMVKTLDLFVSKFPQRYRQFRSLIERNRRK
ncbi:DNA double-strand break repair nuclease NurA [Sulfolobus sp. S-194]|uniref:DNA double-strand break repair nuclease NurA n=1 Tax=Sulfolobus sp. S-194 TaxID=2512240 RepID=UPI00143709F8|nr:DNA double-strand break repair nuclease NurA [Sulfolobus sp. S-194]QIW23012.1 DNA double-strand break repair nuclease NurA [Sulfolobus sp. S-194]